MKRRLFNLAAAVSLVLFLFTVGLWLRSYWRCDILKYTERYDLRPIGEAYAVPNVSGWYVISNSGTVVIRRFENVGFVDAGAITSGSMLYTEEPRVPIRREGMLGFGWEAAQDEWRAFWKYSLKFPHWFVASLLAILPAWRIRAAIRSHKHRGLCPACGYDLRATPDRCPECGAVPAVK